MSTPSLGQVLADVAHEARTLSSSHLRRAAHVAVIAGLLATAFAIAAQSSSAGHEEDYLAESVRRGADRLVALQRTGGAWSRGLAGKPDVRQAGRPAQALLLAHAITHDPRHLRAAERAATAIASELRSEHAATSVNLMFLAEFADATGKPALKEAARQAWMRRYQSELPADGAEAARQLLATPNRSGWLDGAWRNYLLLRAAEEANVARTLGFGAWSDAYVVTAARTWAPKHDHDFWASAAGAMLGALARSSDPAARRLEMVHRGLLETNQIVNGIAWNDTPYDNYVYANETALSLEGRALQEGRAHAGSATFEGLQFLASRQSLAGGWGEVLSLVDDVAESGEGDVAPKDAALAETPELDAQIVRALALGLAGAPGRG